MENAPVSYRLTGGRHPNIAKTLMIMRLTAIFLIGMSLHVAGKAVSQTVSISAKDLPVLQVFDEVKKQTSYLFFYDKDLLTGSKPVTIRVRDMPLREFLSKALKDQPFDFHFENQTIFITKRPQSLEKKEAKLREEEIPKAPPVTGIVTGPDGNPLAGANILIKGTTKGVATDNDGRFSIEADANQVLVISSVGFIAQEITVGTQTSFDIKLVLEDNSLNTVIVTALGISKSVKSLTYSAQDIKGDNINKAKETNIINGLQGKVAGVVITKNATGPGSDSKVLIRGNRSITNSNEPLYVIDGVPLSGNISMLSSDDIESMTILKGASAAALYGSQGQNGAIVITTKRGKSGRPVVGFTTGVQMEQAAVLPELQFEYGQGDAGDYNSSSEHSWGPKISGQTVELWNGHSVKMEGQPDRLKDFFRKGLTLNNTLSIQGGSEYIQAYFSYSNVYAEGILRNNDLLRHNFDLKTTQKITSKLSVFTKLTYIYENVNNRVEPGDAGTYVLPSIFRSPVTIPLSEMKDYAYQDATGEEKQSYWNPGSSVQVNPYWALNRVLNYQQRERILGLVSAKYNFTKWLNLQVRGSLDKTTQNNRHEVYADSYFSQVGSTFDLSETKRQGMNIDGLLSFNTSSLKGVETCHCMIELVGILVGTFAWLLIVMSSVDV